MRISRSLGLLAILSLAACAHTQNSSTFNAAEKIGFSFSAISDTNYRVYYKGEKKQDKFQVREAMIEDAANLTRALGYDYFFLNNEQSASHMFSDIGVVDGVGQLLSIVAVGLFNAKNYEPNNRYSTQLPYPKTHDTRAIEYEIFVTSGIIEVGKGEQPIGSYSEDGYYKGN